MPASFSDFGISFLYPDNWKLRPRDGKDGREGVILELPTGGFCSIDQADDLQDTEALLEQVAKTISAEFGEVEWEPVELPNAGPNEQSIEIQFYYLDLLIQSRATVISARTPRLLVQFQAESRDFDANELVFSAILTQLRAPSVPG
jgi:hypothetical protein